MKKLMKKYKKKYKNICLIFLIVISIILTNYQKVLVSDTKDNNISYIVNYDKYDISNKGYAYVKGDSDFEIQNNVSFMSYKTVVEGDYINFYKFDTPELSYPIVRFSFSSLQVIDNNVIVNNTNYDDFIKLINTNTEYKIFNNDTLVTSGNITNGMVLKVYYNDSIIDTYVIKTQYINLNNLKIQEDKYIISNISLVKSLKEKIITTGNITLLDKNNNLLSDNDYLTTCSKIKINLENTLYEYTIVVLGDITGSGDIFIGDIAKLYQYYKSAIDMDRCYIIAGDVTYDNEIDINDINKLYQYYKGVVSSL